MIRGDNMTNEKSFDRDDEGEEMGGFSGGIPYDDDDDEDGGWAINKDQSDSLWDSAEESDDDEDVEVEKSGGAASTRRVATWVAAWAGPDATRGASTTCVSVNDGRPIPRIPDEPGPGKSPPAGLSV